jgi:hypothetical protein
MSDYELFDLMGRWETNVTIMVIFLVALLSAYLLVAHLAGRSLQRRQIYLLTGLMLWFSFIVISHIYTSLQTLIDVRELAFFGYTTLRKAALYKWLVTLGCSLAPFICVIFMFQMRHPPGLKDRRRKKE